MIFLDTVSNGFTLFSIFIIVMGIFSILILIGIAVYIYQKFFASNRYETRDERYNAERHKRQVELDGLLDKIATQGMESLSDAERRRLDELSGNR